jgi:hypothetical protein
MNTSRSFTGLEVGVFQAIPDAFVIDDRKVTAPPEPSPPRPSSPDPAPLPHRERRERTKA